MVRKHGTKFVMTVGDEEFVLINMSHSATEDKDTDEELERWFNERFDGKCETSETETMNDEMYQAELGRYIDENLVDRQRRIDPEQAMEDIYHFMNFLQGDNRERSFKSWCETLYVLNDNPEAMNYHGRVEGECMIQSSVNFMQ